LFNEEIEMPQLTIIAHGDSAAVVVPPSVLESIGLGIGDVLEATLGEDQLILQPGDNAVRRRLHHDIAHDVFEQRKDAYQRLA